MFLKKNKWIYFTIIILLFTSCVEPIEIKNISFESNLVVRAIITDEFKIQTIKLSNTTEIDSTGIRPEKNATISIIDDTNIVYKFQETNEGIYESTNEFKAIPNKAYTLNIKTENGVEYSSTPEKLPSIAQIENIFIDVEENNIGEKRAVVKTNSFSLNNNGQYYRYEYEETFKVKAPLWSYQKILIISDIPPYEFDIVLKSPEDGIGFCYGTRKSKNIVLTETQTLSEDKVLNFPVRFIPLESYIIGIRYSILLKQYVLNKNTYDYYQLLNKFSNPDNIFSQIQVGNIPSNISSISGKKVIGFFEVSSISIKRNFFNRNEITTESSYINYQKTNTCADGIVQPKLTNSLGQSPLLSLLPNYVFLGYANPPAPPNQPYRLATKECGTCTSIGPPIKPSFWID